MTLRGLLIYALDGDFDLLDTDVFLGPALKPLEFVELVGDPSPPLRPYIVLHGPDE